MSRDPASAVQLTWNGKLLSGRDWVSARSNEIAMLDVSHSGSIRCYLDEAPLSPEPIPSGTRFHISAPSSRFAPRRLEVRAVDTNDQDKERLLRSVSIIPSGHVVACWCVIVATMAVLGLIGWRLWHVRLGDGWSSASAALSGLSAVALAMFGVDDWRKWLGGRLATTNFPGRIGAVVVVCVVLVLFEVGVVYSFMRVVHNATSHDLHLDWSGEPRQSLAPGEVEVIWSSASPPNLLKELPLSDRERYCAPTHSRDRTCKAFRAGQQDANLLQKLFSIAPFVSIGCVVEIWNDLPEGTTDRMVQPLGASCLPEPTTKDLSTSGGAKGAFAYRKGTNVNALIAGDHQGVPLLKAAVHWRRLPGSASEIGAVPEKVRVSVRARDHGVFQEAWRVTAPTEATELAVRFPVPSPRRGHTTIFELAPEQGDSFGTLTCYPRNTDVDVWIISASSGSILRVQLDAQGGRILSSWEATKSQVAAGGSPVFGLCLPAHERPAPSRWRSGNQPGEAPARLELTLVVRQVGQLLEPTQFQLPEELAQIGLHAIGEDGYRRTRKIGELACSVNDATDVVMLQAPPHAQRVELLASHRSGADRPAERGAMDRGAPAAGDPECSVASFTHARSFSAWNATGDADDAKQLFHCMPSRRPTLCQTDVSTPRGRARWTFEGSHSPHLVPPPPLPGCWLNPQGKLITGCTKAGVSAEDLWRQVWQLMKSELTPHGCTLGRARVCL